MANDGDVFIGVVCFAESSAKTYCLKISKNVSKY